jgi:hypothetical protein
MRIRDPDPGWKKMGSGMEKRSDPGSGKTSRIRNTVHQQMKNANSEQRRDVVRGSRVHACVIVSPALLPTPSPDLITGQPGEPHIPLPPSSIPLKKLIKE